MKDPPAIAAETPAAPASRTLKPVLAIAAAVAGGFAVYHLLGALAASPALMSRAGGLSTAARSLAAIFFAVLVLWSTEAIPIAATSLLVLVVLPLLGVAASIGGAAAGFTSPVVFFVIGAYCLAIALVQSGLGHRFALYLFTLCGTNSRRAVFAVMAGSAAISAVISDVPACAIWMALSLPILSRIGAQPGRSNLGKVMMMGIPIASLIGGVATPAGSSINILGLNLLKKSAGIDVSFLQWMALGVPMVIVLIPVAWWVLIRFFPPEIDSIGDMDLFKEELRAKGALQPREIKVVLILAVMFTLWVLSTWIRQLDVALISLAGAVVMFAPGIDLLKWKEVEKNIGWETILMIGSVTSLGLASSDTGLSEWLVRTTLGGITGWHVITLVAAISAFTVVLHLPLPIAPTINAVLIPAMVVLARDSGHNPALFALPVAFTASCAFLLPLDAVPLVTYSKGYYRMLDMLAPGSIISIAWVILMTLLMVTVARLIGL
jgi:solute carrier family 13 (sodium-dependent dicarboxylate transporter), member 2/3/5